jgi:hypothetical protein
MSEKGRAGLRLPERNENDGSDDTSTGEVKVAPPSTDAAKYTSNESPLFELRVSNHSTPSTPCLFTAMAG